jgi:hypothetical protein
VLRVLALGLLGLSLSLRDASGEQGREPWRRRRTGEPLRSLAARSCSPARAPRSTGDGPAAASAGGGERECIDQALNTSLPLPNEEVQGGRERER